MPFNQTGGKASSIVLHQEVQNWGKKFGAGQLNAAILH
jgi:hypothetical protein